MKNSYIVVAIVILVVLGAGGFLVLRGNSNQSGPSVTSTNNSKTEDSAPNSQATGSTKYLSYSKKVLEESASKKRVLYFYANWCPICRPADADFKANESKIPDDVVVIRVNYNDSDTDDEEKALAQKYGITYQHTFVQIDENGEEVAKWNGGDTDELLTNFK